MEEVVSEWISVKELDKLPQMFKRVLVTNGYMIAPWIARRWTGCNEGAARFIASQQNQDIREIYCWLTDNDSELDGVTHWMPLPPPPNLASEAIEEKS